MKNGKQLKSGFGLVHIDIIKSNISDSAKTMYAYLAAIQGSSNECFPSVAKMAADLNKSPATIKRCTKELRDSGFIDVLRRYDSSNIYIVKYIYESYDEILERANKQAEIESQLRNERRVSSETSSYL